MSTMAKWRNKEWVVSPREVLALENLAFSYEQQADNNSSTESQAPTNQRGTQLVPLTFKTVLHSGAGVDVRSEIEQWKGMVTLTGPFYLNGRQLGPKFQLRKVAVSDVKLDNSGRMLLATLSFTFKEYDKDTTSVPETTTSALKVAATPAVKAEIATPPAAVQQAPARGIKVGDYVYPTGTRYYTGQKIPDWVKQRKHRVGQINGAKTLIGYPGGIASWVYTNEISLW